MRARRIIRKRIIAFMMAAAMIFGDVTPVLATESSNQGDVIQESNISEEGSSDSGFEPEKKEETGEGSEEIPGDSDEKPETGDEEGENPEESENPEEGENPEEDETPEEDDNSEESEELEEDEDEDIEDEDIEEALLLEDTEVTEGEEDASEYVLQAGGNGILPETEDEDGSALFSLQEDRAVAAIVEGLKAREPKIDVSSYGLTEDTLEKVYVRALNNNPSLFYVQSKWSYSYNPSNGQIVSVTPVYLPGYNEYSSKRYDEAVQKALESINDNMSDIEKALALHDYLAMNCAYENDGKGNYQKYNAYDALVTGEAVCQGYTLAYIELLQRAGVGVSYATSNAMNHIWNLVELGGKWYHVDVTWDDPTPDYTGRVRHSNFLCSDDGINKAGHYSWVTEIDGVTCTDDSYAAGQFWNGLTSAVIYQGTTCYYMSSAGNIVELSGDGSEKNVYELKDKRWDAAWDGGGYWSGVYTGLSCAGNYLYCNDKLHVYRISLSTLKAEEIYEYTGGKGYIYGTRVCDDKLMLAVSQNPNNIPTRMTVELPKPVETLELYQLEIKDGREEEKHIGKYRTFEEAKEQMKGGESYRIRLMDNATLVTGDELSLPENIECELDLNGYTLNVPLIQGNAAINADLYGGSSGKGVIKVAKNQSLILNTRGSETIVSNLTISFDASSQSGELKLEGSSSGNPLTFTQVNVIGTPALLIDSNITMDSGSNFAIGALKVDDSSENVVLDGKLTAKTFETGSSSLIVRELTVSGETVVEGGFELNVKGNADFGKVTVQNSDENNLFLIKLIKIVDEQNSEISTGAVKFTGALVKASGAAYAVELQRMKAVQGNEDIMENDPFMPEDIIATLTAADSMIPIGYFRVPEDAYGRELCLVREGNFLKVKGAVLEVSLKGQAGAQKYISMDEAVARMASDFGNEKGDYIFTFLSDASLTKNITLPAMVQTLELKTSEKQDNERLFANLDMKGYTLNTAAALKLYEGLKIVSSGKRGQVILTGTADDGQDFQAETLTGEVKWINAIGEELGEAPDSRTMLDGVDISVDKGVIVLQAEGSVVLNSNISAKELRVENGNWVLGDVTISSVYSVSQSAEVKQSAANGYTIENAGYFQAGTIQMSVGTFRNYGTAQIDSISNIKSFVNTEDAVLVCNTFNQSSNGSSRLESGSVMAVKEKAVLYNIELGGAYFYQLEGSNTSFEGKVTLAADTVSDEGIGLRYGIITENTFDNLLKDGNKNVSVKEIAPQTKLFSTRISVFPSTYVSALQPDENSSYTMVYQIGQNILVGREWIVISARKLDADKVDENEEQHLRSFMRWTDAVAYLSDLSNPNLIYIVDILDDLDIEQGLTMPAKSAGLVIRGTNMPDEAARSVRTNILTYTGDLNLTTNVEFSNIELRAKKNNVDYQSAVTLNGKSLTFSNGACGTFAAIKGNAASALVLNDSKVEVRGALTVGELRSEEGGGLIGLATVKRDKSDNITAVTPQITVSGKISIDKPITIGLQEKVTVNKVVSYEMINFAGTSGGKIRKEGIQLLKAVYAQPEDFEVSEENFKVSEENKIRDGILTKKNGYLLWFEGTEYSVILRYGSEEDRTEIPCTTFSDAVAEINSLKTKQPYTIVVQKEAEEISGNTPAALTMPNKNYISELRIEADSSDTVILYYLGNPTLTADTVLKDVKLCQMVKVGKEYVPADDAKEDYPAPVTLSTGGFGLTIEGKVRFNTPLNLNGVNKGTFTIAKGASLTTETNKMKADADNTSDSVIVGSVQKFKTFNIAEGQSVRICQYGTKSAKGITYTAATLNGTEMTVSGDLTVENGNATIRDLVLNGGKLRVTGEKAGKAVLTNVTMEGNKPEIFVDRDFTISGTLTNLVTDAELYTRQKPEVKGNIQMPYLNITGKVVTESGKQITIGVRPNDCATEEMVSLKDAPQASAQLLTAKSAGVECFAADPDNVHNAGAYGPGNENGYMLVKTGSNIYAYDSEHVVVALCKGTVSNRDLADAEVINYYPGWQEAVVALNALNQKTEIYTMLLLKDIGTQDAPLSLSMPSKAEMVYVTSVNSDSNSKSIFYRNNMALGTNMEFANVELAPATANGSGASLGFSVNNFALTLRDIQVSEAADGMSVKDITGKGKGSVTLVSEGLTLSGGISGVKVLTVQENATVTGAVKADTLMLQGDVEFTAKGAITVTNIENGDGQNTLVYGRTAKNQTNLTINGTITNTDRDNPLQLQMSIPEGNDWDGFELIFSEVKGVNRAALSDTIKLAVMPKASTADFIFCFETMKPEDFKDYEAFEEFEKHIVKADKGLYLVDDEVAGYTVGLKSSAKEGINICMDLTQAMNEINTLADGTADYTLYLLGDFGDTNITDNNPYGALTMPASGKAKSVTLTGSDENGVKYDSVLTFSGNITAFGNLMIKDLCLNPVKSISDDTPADFNISVTGNAKSGASLTLDNVQTAADEKWDWTNQDREIEETGFINQISGIKNLTNVTIIDSKLRLKTGINNVNELSLDAARLITCKTSAVNDLSMNGSSWDALGVTTITNVTNFAGSGGISYLATKQAAKTFLPQLTINGKVEDTVTCKVIEASASVTQINYVDSYKDVKLAKLPKEAAGKLTVLWEDIPEGAENSWVYYKDTANYVLCGDSKEMVIKLTGTNGEGIALAETYAKCYQDAVTIINNLNDARASYRIEFLQSEIMTGKDGAFGAMAFPANNKAESIILTGSGQSVPIVTFSGNITAYGNVTLENLELCAVKNIVSSEPVDFSISINGVKDASSLALENVKISENGGKLNSINGNSKASVTLNSEGLSLSGSINGVTTLTIEKDTVVDNAVKANTLKLQGGIEFTAKGAVTVTDIENVGGKNTLTYGRTAKNVPNLTVNGAIINTEGTGQILKLKMLLPEGTGQTAYELGRDPLKTDGFRVVLNDTKKLSVLPKVSTDDFEFCIGDNSSGTTIAADKLVKANKGLYLASKNVADDMVILETEKGTSIQCLDLNQAVSEINTLADGTADYTLILRGDCADANVTDANAYSALTMPGNGKAGSVTLKGESDGEYTSVLTFSGNITAYGNITMENLALNPMKGVSNNTPADFNISVTGNAKSGASLTLDNVQTAADGEWKNASVEKTGFINQISGTKNVTNVTIKGSALRLKTGLTNVNELSLNNDTRLITCKAVTVNNLSMDDSGWDALGVTTITNVTHFAGSGDNCYLAAKQAAKTLQPQLTINGVVKDIVTCKVIEASASVTEIKYVDSYRDVKLAKMPKEAAGKLTVLWEKIPEGAESLWVVPGNRVYYKDTSNFVLCGDINEMAVRLTGTNNGDMAYVDTYAKCYQDAVTIINNTNEPKALYEIEFLRAGEIRTGKGGEIYGALTLPTKAAGVILRGAVSDTDTVNTYLCYTGTLKPNCPTTFENLVLTEGTLKKNVFAPTYQITPVLGNVNVTFENVSTMQNPNAGADETEADMVFASASAAKGVLTLKNESVYAKGNFVIKELCVSGDVKIIADKAVTLTNITGEEGIDKASLRLDTKVTAITKAGQQSLTQLTLNGKISGVEVSVAPRMYDLSRKAYHRMTSYEARAMQATSAKPDVSQKLANLSKTFDGVDSLIILYSSDGNSWKSIAGMTIYNYSNGLYMRP